MLKKIDSDTITFGKYKNSKLQVVLKDRPYCKWLVEQEWFKKNYEYLYNRVVEYNPLKFFLKEEKIFFNLIPLEELKIELTDKEKKSYKFYLHIIDELKSNITYDIKAPHNWSKIFEEDTNLKREDFKLFINSYDLPNIVENIKKEGVCISKKRCLKQEKYWEEILKKKYGEDISTQFKYEDYIFDFINIKTNTIFECKLALKDFNEEQYNKYILTLEKYKIIYLIGYDCIIDIDKKTVYTIDLNKYKNIIIMSNSEKFDDLIRDFYLIEIDELIVDS